MWTQRYRTSRLFRGRNAGSDVSRRNFQCCNSHHSSEHVCPIGFEQSGTIHSNCLKNNFLLKHKKEPAGSFRTSQALTQQTRTNRLRSYHHCLGLLVDNHDIRQCIGFGRGIDCQYFVSPFLKRKRMRSACNDYRRALRQLSLLCSCKGRDPCRPCDRKLAERSAGRCGRGPRSHRPNGS